MEVDLPASRGPSPRVESDGDAPDEGAASRGPGSPALRRHLGTAANSPHQISTAARLQSFDRDKNVSFLLKELDALRGINNKLQDQLVQKEKELQRREVEEELREEQREAQHWGRPAAVLEEVLAAQKDRDQALMSRLLLANEERDEALLRARRLQQAAESERVNLEDTNLDIDELLQQVCDADSVQDIQQFGSVLVERLRLARQRRNDITAQEMKAVMEERDGSVAKCKRLEQDLLQEREQWASEDELLRLERERDGAVEDRRRLEAEIQALRANHSSQDLAPPSQPSSQDDRAPPPTQVESQQTPPPQSPPPQSLLIQLQQMSKEKQSVEAELQRCQQAEREASERVRRLERLVEVLRKKVGTGSLRAVI
ncbi:mirror-image polydactyly gene 1 protein [Stegastes partitus]|uniref:Mirror-image polydactyly gene 1 protein n=1 Tax=Stegastes partitus TaxID=144197 RepID=A0A9Y4KLI7_9TELE|nr:PREDICTED: mirror-image polydactyly gene 1 protein [Stegastes partitus]